VSWAKLIHDLLTDEQVNAAHAEHHQHQWLYNHEQCLQQQCIPATSQDVWCRVVWLVMTWLHRTVSA
jgi:hypothetical protein